MILQGLGHTHHPLYSVCLVCFCVCVLWFNVVRLLATITPLLRSMCGSGILWCLTGTWCCECLLHLAYVLANVCVWCLTDTWSYVLAICLCLWCLTGTWSYVLAICLCVWCLTGTWSYVLAICLCVWCLTGTRSYVLAICLCVWCLTGTWLYVLAICLCVWCLCLVLAALWLYVKSGAWRAPDARGEWPL